MNKIKYFIWVDDERVLPHYIDGIAENFIVCKTYKQAIKALDTYCAIGNVYLDLDHDLGCRQNGYDIAKYIVENQIKVGAVAIHSANPVGRFNINQLLTHYGYEVL